MKWIPCVLLVLSGCFLLPRVEGGVGSSRPAAVEEREAEEGREPLLILPRPERPEGSEGSEGSEGPEGSERGLPPELWLLILRELSIEDLARLAGVCQALRRELAEPVRVLRMAADGNCREWLQWQDAQAPGVYAGLTRALLKDRVKQLAGEGRQDLLLWLWLTSGGQYSERCRQVFEGVDFKCREGRVALVSCMEGRIAREGAAGCMKEVFMRLEDILYGEQTPGTLVAKDIFLLLGNIRERHLDRFSSTRPGLGLRSLLAYGVVVVGSSMMAFLQQDSWGLRTGGAMDLAVSMAGAGVLSGFYLVLDVLSALCKERIAAESGKRELSEGEKSCMVLLAEALVRLKAFSGDRTFFQCFFVVVWHDRFHLSRQERDLLLEELGRRGIKSRQGLVGSLLYAAWLGWKGESDIFRKICDHDGTLYCVIGRMCCFVVEERSPSDEVRQQCSNVRDWLLPQLCPGGKMLFRELLETVGSDFARELAIGVLVAD